MLNEVQSKLLDMLKWFHGFCEENRITYYVLGGTLLGAVRHKGFIPWDDDIDIGLPREDYERLKQCSSELPADSRYVLETPSENKDFDYLYCKLYDTKTTLIEHTRARAKRGLYLDIFPLDGIGNAYDESLKNYKKILSAINFYNTRVCALRKGRKLYKNLAILVSRCIPSVFYNKKKRAEKIDRMCAAREYRESAYVGNLLGNWGKREIVERAWMGEATLYTFEDMQVYGPCDADKKKDSKALAQFFERAVKDEDIILKSAGRQRFSYCYVADAVSGLIKILLDGENGGAYNISEDDEGKSLGDYAAEIAAFAGRKVVMEEQEVKGASTADYAVLDCAKLKSLGWQPFFSVSEGMKRTYTIYKGE